MQFIVTAYDFIDDDAINRRMANREAHLYGLKETVRKGNIYSVGAIMDSDQKMIGSSAHVEFLDRRAVEEWIESDPYFHGKVWGKIDIVEAKFISF